MSAAGYFTTPAAANRINARRLDDNLHSAAPTQEHSGTRQPRRALLAAACLLASIAIFPTAVFAAITVTPSTWNVIGLDSNTPAFGPYRFPVGAKVCSTTAATNVPVTFNWDAGGTDNGTYIDLRPGSNSSLTIPSIAAGTCTDAFFEVEINRSPLAYDKTRRFYISAGGVNTPRPREIKVERLVSQSRNAITNIEFGTSLASLASVPNGGSMDLVIGNTYFIRMSGYTATQGYEQLESFINFPNTIFQIISVNTTYSADTSPIVNSPNDKLYADACGWDSDPSSPSYLSCYSDGKAGGTVVVTYQVKIVATAGGRETLNSLIHDFSGSSFHYNADYSTSARFANIVDPTALTISKNFAPDPSNVGGVSSLTFTLSNPNSGTLSGVSFTDVFPAQPAAPGNMTLANTITTNTCGGTLTDNSGGGLNTDDAGVRLSGATIPANGSCSVVVNVTTSSTGIYTNTTNNVFVGTTDTGKGATDTLTVNTDPPAGTGICGTTLAKWTFPTGFSTVSPAPSTGSGSAAAGAGITSIQSSKAPLTSTVDGTTSWGSNGAVAAGVTLVASNDDYFEFAVNTTNYSEIYLSFYARRDGTNGVKGVAVYYSNYSDNSNPETSVYSDATVLSGGTGWVTFGNFTIPVTASTTYVRIYGFNAGNSNTASDIYIDDVTFTGCQAPIQPTIAKAFSPAPVASGAISTLTLTLNNTNAIALTGATFTDTFPAGMTVATPLTTANTCGGSLLDNTGGTLAAGDAGIRLTGGTIPAGGSCQVAVNVTALSGTYSNTSGFLATAEGGQNKASIATATLKVLAPPAISKNFASDPIFINGTSKLTFLVTNPNQNDPLSGIAFTDTFPTSPGNMLVASAPNANTSNCGTPTFAPAAGAAAISFSNGTIAGGGTCTVTVDVTAPTAGTYSNTSGNVSHILNGTWSGDSANDTLTVETPNPAIALLKQVAPASSGPWSSYLAVTAGGNVFYRFTVENLGDVPLSPFSVSDPGLPAPLGMASCTWKDGDGAPLAAPLTLPVADADNGHIASCILGPTTAAVGTFVNTATASGTYGATTVTDTSTATYATSALTLAKHADKSYFLAAGETISYSYVISNTGAAILTGPLTVSVADNMISTVSCPAIITVGNLNADFDPGENLTCTASYTTTASDVFDKEVVNIARATVSGVNITTQYTAQVTKTVPLGPDLAITKSNSVGGNAATNTPFTWTLTVGNSASAGPAAIANGQTLLTDNLPTSGATYSVPAVATNAGGTTGVVSCAIAANTLTCTANGPVTIPTGGSLSIAVTTTPTAAGSLVNPLTPGGICKVDPGTVLIEIDETNNNCGDTVTVTTPAVTLLKTADKPYFVAAGELLTYTYRIRNTGAMPIAGPATVADDKVAVTCNALSTATVFAPAPGPGNGDGNLDPNEEVACTSAPYTILAADLTAREVINTATATLANAGLPVSSPQIALTVPIGPDLSITKGHDSTGVASPGIPFDWTLTTTNSAAAGYPAAFTTGQLLLTDDLPAGPVYSVPATATNTGNTTGTITCAIAAGTLTCTAGDDVSIPPGGSFAIAVTTTPAAGGSLVNPRDAGICRVDPAAVIVEISDSNNDCADTVSVGLPLLAVIKSADRATATPGDLINYTLVISNSGPVIARNIKVDDFMGRFTALRLDPYGNGTPFNFVPQTSGLAIQSVEYSNDTDPSDGITYGYTPADPDGDGIDDSITRWRITMGGDMQPAPSQFTLRYQAQVK